MRSLRLAAHATSVARARDFASAEAARSGADVEVVALLTSELVTNVLRHTSSEVTVHVSKGPPFRVEVHDGLAADEAFRDLVAEPSVAVPPESVGGRGLAIVKALATRFGLEREPDGKVVWFEV